MIFSCIVHQVDSSPAVPTGEVARPEIPIRIYGPEGWIEITALLDTGADHVFLSACLAELLGIDIQNMPAESAEGAGGHRLRLWPAEVEFEVFSGESSRRWRAQVGFIEGDEEPAAAYLGHVGFLEYFQATFNYERREVELIAKD